VHDELNNHGFTRRRALALGAAGGVSGLLLRSGAAAAAGAASSVRTAGLALPPGAVPAGGRTGTIIATAQPFDLVGLRGVNLRGAGAELRVRRRGHPWSAWVPLGAGADHAPDAPKAAPASDPVWAGGADELQLRARRALRGGRLQLVTAPAADDRARARAAARATPRGTGAPAIIPRAAWGADQVPPRADPSYGAVQLAFVHHTVSANAYRPEDSARIVLSIAKYHRDSNGWNDIGYNFLVDQYGQVFEGRAGGIDQAVIGAQAGGWNSQSTGIATIGDFDKTTLPEAAVAVIARLIAWKLSLHGAATSGAVTLASGGGRENRYPYGQQVSLQRVSGHRDGCHTDCPGALLYGQLDDLRRRVASIGPIATASARVALLPVATRVRFGEEAILRGQVLGADGAPATDVPVSIQKRTSTGGWARVASARTAADGTYEARLVWKREAALRAQAQLSPGTAGRVRSPVATVGLDTVVSILAPGERSRVQAGRSVAVRGSIGPSGPVRIMIERQVPSGRWVAAGQVRARVGKTTFAASVPLKKPALYRLTAVGGTTKAPVRTPLVFVRAVRRASSVGGGQGGASASVAPPPGAAGGVAAP
jgi:hypothetical protein